MLPKKISQSRLGVGEWSFRMLDRRGRHKIVTSLTTLETYADESSTGGTKCCVVLGLCGSTKQWRQVEERWRKACGSIVFHGKQFFQRTPEGQRIGPYQKWSDEQARQFLSALFDAIGERLTLVGGIIDVKAFNRQTEAERRYLTLAQFQGDRWRGTGAPSKPWFMGFGSVLVQSAGCVKQPGMRVNFWFDRQDEYAGHANQMFNLAVDRPVLPWLSKRFGALVFEAKDLYPGLQAADLVAYTAGSVYEKGRVRRGDQEYAVSRMRAMSSRVTTWNETRIASTLAGAARA